MKIAKFKREIKINANRYLILIFFDIQNINENTTSDVFRPMEKPVY